MRILIDTNVFIHREDSEIVPNPLIDLLRLLQESGNFYVIIHPLSVEEIKKDKNQERREIVLSKIKTYPSLEDPPNPREDQTFLKRVGDPPKDSNDFVDNCLLFCVYKDAVDFLVTQDKEIHKKSEIIYLSDRIFNIEEAYQYFKKISPKTRISSPPSLVRCPVYNLNINDPIFDSLKEEYPNFKDWWQKISRKGREAWVYFKENKKVGAILIYKLENEPIDSIPPLPAKKRVKICTLIVFHTGYKIGELFIKMSIEFAIKNNHEEMYLTHFTKSQDELIDLIEEFGFQKKAEKRNGEDIYYKSLIPTESLDSPKDIAKKFYPSFYDGTEVKKFIVPIRPEYHNKLFMECKQRQPTLLEYTGKLIIEGNTIKKAYLSHSKNRSISCGDILLFYRSQDRKEVTSLGVAESVYHDLQDPNEIMRYVGKRTVYSVEEIREMAKIPTTVILFRWHFDLPNPIKWGKLTKRGILKGAPQGIVGISHEKYLKVKGESGLDERFTIN